MKINVYTTHDKLSVMTQATSERVIWRNARLATLNPDYSQPYGLLERHALLVRNGRTFLMDTVTASIFRGVW